MQTSTTRRLGVAAAVAATLLAGVVTTAGAAPTTLPTSEQPLTNTARVMDGYVYDIDRVGDTVVVAGEFSTVRDFAPDAPDQTRNFLFAYDLSTGEVSQTFVPVVDDIVHAVHITDDGSQVLVAGRFRTVNGQAQRGTARLDLADGALDPTWQGATSSGVLSMAVTDDEVVIGGWFDWAGGLRRPRLAALDPVTGQGIADFDFDLQGRVNPAPASGQLTQVIELDATADGRWLGLVGNQTSIDGQPRGQIALIDLDDYSLADWRVPALETWPCSRRSTSVSYVQDIGFSPDGTYLVMGSLGAYRQPDSLCDVVARFELPPVGTGAMTPTWANYTGGDSIFQVAVTDAAVYAGGHQRWANNAFPTNDDAGTIRGDRDGPGSVERFGIGAFDPTSGVPLSWFPNRDRTRPRRGFQAIVPSGDLLLLGSDSTQIGGLVRQRLASYAIVGGPENPLPESKDLPVTLYTLTGADDVLSRVGYDGGAVTGSPVAVSGAGIDGVDWSGTGDGFLQHGELVTFTTDGRYSARSFDAGAVGPAVVLSQTVGYVDSNAVTLDDQPYGVEDTDVAAYLDGRILYTRGDSDALWWRWYSTESGIIGSRQFLVDDSRDWRADAGAMTVLGGRLYVATTGGELASWPLASDHTGVRVDGPSRLEDDGSNGIDWADVELLFAELGDDTAPPETTIESPTAGALLPPSVLLEGTASDDRQVARVDVTVRDTATDEYLQLDGTFAPAPAVLAAPVVEAVPGLATWTLPVDLPETLVEVTATAVDGSGNVDPTPSTTSFTTATVPVDTTITTPTFDEVLEPGPVTIAGEATDAVVGVAAVDVTVRDRDTLAWLQPDGSFAADFALLPATLAAPGATTTGWSLDVDLPAGSWGVTARATDSDGEEEVDGAFVDFTTTPVAVDAVEPDTVVTDPAAFGAVGSGDVTITGTASDDTSGVAAVDVAVRRIADGTWLRADGSFGGFQWLPAAVDAVGATSTTWTTTVPLPDTGAYAVVPRATDVAGNVESQRPYHRFDVVAAPDDTVAPGSTITAPAARAVVPAGSVTITGTATDDQSGVALVEVTVRNRRTLDWLQPDGTFAPGFALVPATVAAPGATSTTWILDVTVAPDDYAITSRVTDLGGNTQPSPTWSPFTAS